MSTLDILSILLLQEKGIRKFDAASITFSEQFYDYNKPTKRLITPHHVYHLFIILDNELVSRPRIGHYNDTKRKGNGDARGEAGAQPVGGGGG